MVKRFSGSSKTTVMQLHNSAEQLANNFANFLKNKMDNITEAFEQ